MSYKFLMESTTTLNAKRAVEKLLSNGRKLQEIQAEQWKRMMEGLEGISHAMQIEHFLSELRFQGFNAIGESVGNADEIIVSLIGSENIKIFFDAQREVKESIMEGISQATKQEQTTSTEGKLASLLSKALKRERPMALADGAARWLMGIGTIAFGLRCCSPDLGYTTEFFWQDIIVWLSGAGVAVGIGALWWANPKRDSAREIISIIVDAAILQVIREMRAEQDSFDIEGGCQREGSVLGSGTMLIGRELPALK